MDFLFGLVCFIFGCNGIRLFELVLGAICIGFLLYEFAFFVLAPFYNGGHLPSLTYMGCGINLCVIGYLTQLEYEIFG